MSEPQDIECVLVQEPGGDTPFDWFTLERKNHDGREWSEPKKYNGWTVNMWSRSARLHKHSDIEGPAYEWRAIASAIERGESAEFRRCAAIRVENGYEFFSPRNSNDNHTLLTFEAARRVAEEIRRVVGGVP